MDSDAWENAGRYDPIEVEIDSLLSDYKNQAFSINEIEEHLHGEHQHLFPDQIVGGKVVDGAKAARQAIVATILEKKYWHSEVKFRYVSEAENAEPGLYFTWNGPGINPIAEVDDVSDPDPESPWMTLSGRFQQIEKDVEGEMSDLEDRVDWLEFRVHEELGQY